MFEENSLIGKISRGDYPKKTVKTKYGTFTMRFCSGKDKTVITRKLSLKLGGVPVDSIPGEFYGRALRDVTLSVAIVDYPTDFPDEFKRDDIEDFPDEEVKNRLFKLFSTFSSDTQDTISREP